MTFSDGEMIQLPVLPLRDVVVYPHMVIPLFVGRPMSVKALDVAMGEDQRIFLVAQQSSAQDDPVQDELYDVGTIAQVLQLLRLPDGTLKVLVEGEQRAFVKKFVQGDGHLSALLEVVDDDAVEVEAKLVQRLMRPLMSQFDQYVKLNKKIPPEVISALTGIESLARLVDTIAAHMNMKIEDRQRLLEISDIKQRVETLMSLLETEIDFLQVEKKIRGRVKGQMEKNQREYYLNEQMKAIQKELGEIEEGMGELDILERDIEKAKMPQEAHDKAISELKRLKTMSPMSSEASVSRTYIETMISIPWSKRSRLNKDLAKAKKVLNTHHDGLDKVKELILEHLAVQLRVGKVRGPILCLVGPPGVGKTSLGKAIAEATGREYVRMALGGVRDEAEIRGHRRTYVGSMPGKIIQKLVKTKVRNPLFLLDEIDKMAMDFRGDPSSALLEVLDPEQNDTFNDHYLEVDYDLSEVMFVATSNSYDIPPALLDRMEIIDLSGYTEDEKLSIAKKFLVKKSMKKAGLKRNEISFTSDALQSILRYYTREAGVRWFDREIAKICRKVVKEILLSARKKTPIEVTPKRLEKYLGVQRFDYGVMDKDNRIGQVNGLSYSSVGGDLLKIEVAVMPGKGRIHRTGNLGDVMKESIDAALSVVRARAKTLGISEDFHEKHDLHVHVPQGATPKEGPSAGLAITTAMVSALTKTPVHRNVAMTGEINLHGEALGIGGLKEKLLAAKRGGVDLVLIPEENRKDLKDIPKNVKEALEIKIVKSIDQVLKAALDKAKVKKVRDKAANKV